MALARIRSVEQLRYQAPGEWGKVLGLDRIPEVRTLREKIEMAVSGPGARQRMEWSLGQRMDGATGERGSLFLL
jgi:hypothetical protein